MIDAQASVITETAAATDQVFGQRKAASLVVETAKATDATRWAASILIQDGATATDLATGRLRARDMLAETAQASDESLDSHQSVSHVRELGIATSEAFGWLHARNVVEDAAVAEGYPIGGDLGGQAWTANADSWAMSRYEPYTFSSLAVIDGALYGVAADGVYALSGGQELVTARVTTGKLDMSGGVLVHPLAAYAEYELDSGDQSRAEMVVTTTQGGAKASYTYPMDGPEVADELANGRFKFGKGLRGRHFAYELRITGKRAHINDLRIDLAQTKRRV